MISRLDLDQLAIFVAIVDEGGFAAAGRQLGRGQSVVTYAVQELEADLRVALFDRSGYRPSLTDAGRALLPRARRVLGEAMALQTQAHGIAGGLEASLSMVVDAMFPMEALTEALRSLQVTFPSVRIDIRVDALGAAADVVVEGAVDLGLVVAMFAPLDRLEHEAAGTVELVPVCSPGHALASLSRQQGRPLRPEQLQDHVQLVLADRSPRTGGQQHGVTASTTWRLADLGAKQAMLRAGLGWGSLPRHIAKRDLASGDLVRLDLADRAGSEKLPQLALCAVRRPDHVLGPAGRHMFALLTKAPRSSTEQDTGLPATG